MLQACAQAIDFKVGHHFGEGQPGHLWKDVKLVWRELQMSMGKAPKDSSPAKQEKLGLNRDATFSWKKSEGKKLRE
jgi:hypothetical protein